MGVRRCICHDISFDELLWLSRRTGADFRGLRDLTGASQGCGMCAPYIHKALATGDTDVPVMKESEQAHWLHGGGSSAANS